MFHKNLARYAERIPGIERKLDFLHEVRAWFNVDEAWRVRLELAERITHTSILVSDPNWFEACALIVLNIHLQLWPWFYTERLPCV